jgi:hypothetical protein
VHPGYSPDAAPSDFFFFGYLKGEMAGFTVNSPADILSEIRRISQEISQETLMGCMTSGSHGSNGQSTTENTITRSKRNPVRIEMSELPPGHKLLEPLYRDVISSGAAVFFVARKKNYIFLCLLKVILPVMFYNSL